MEEKGEKDVFQKPVRTVKEEGGMREEGKEELKNSVVQ